MGGGTDTTISICASVGIGTTITNPKSIAAKNNFFILSTSLSITDANVLSRHYNDFSRWYDLPF
jgi:hypothetical protein